MNRETKRMLQRQGQLGPDGEAARAPRPAPQSRAPRAQSERVGPRQYLREVRGELRKVAWPTRPEVIRYSTIVLVTLVILTTLIFFLDYAFAKSVFFLFDQ
ncbi:MAG: preprotein translocase subunit SecE [Acidimicrobiia bacterium]